MAARGLGGAAVDLALVFVSPQHVGQAQAVAEVVHHRLAPRVLAGACGESVIGRGRDAVDVALTTSYGASELISLNVRADQVDEHWSLAAHQSRV